MRLSTYALSALAANLVAALPRPQDIDLDMVVDTPDPTFSEAVGAAAQTVTYDTASIIAEATASVSSVSIEISDVLSSTAVVSNLRRGAATTCVPQPSGATSAPTYAAGADTDNASVFLANTYYASVASAAPTPSGYNQAFVNQQASNNAFGYMGFDTFDTYDVTTCASRCSAKDGCVSINMYFERDPSVDPNDASCSNPASVTVIKCVYWGGPVSQDSAVNKGQMRGGFTVAIAGSNGYVTNQIKTPAGYQAGVPYGKFAINAPYDAQGYNTFMGSKLFTSTWDAASCAAYCDSQTKYNLATAPKDGTPAKVCNFFNTYVLTAHKADGSVVPQGQYCALYTEAWTPKQATNGGQWRGQDQYVVSYSFGYPKLNAGIAPTAGDVTGAVYQARQDMTYSPSSLTAIFQPFCSSLLMYTAPVASVTASTTTTPVTLTTVVVTSTLPANAKRAAASSSSIPAVLTKYPSAVIASACGLIATSPTITSTVTAATTTVIAATQISTITSVTSVAAARATPQSPVPPFPNYCAGLPSFFLQASAPGTNVDQQFGWVSGGINIYFQRASSLDATVMCFDSNGYVHAGWNNHILVQKTDITDPFIGFVDQRDMGDYDIVPCSISNGFFTCQDASGRSINQASSTQEWFVGSSLVSGNSPITIYAYKM